MSNPTTSVRFGDSTVTVRYEADPGEPDTRDEPGYPPSLEITEVLINGVWVLPGLFNEDWYDEAIEEIADELRFDAEEMAIARRYG